MVAISERAISSPLVHRVLLVDDDVVARAGVRLFLQFSKQVRVIGEADTGEEAVLLALALSPDVILLDLVLPDLTAGDVIRRLRSNGSAARFVALVNYSDEKLLPDAIRAGIAGYLLKDAPPKELIRAIVCGHPGEFCGGFPH